MQAEGEMKGREGRGLLLPLVLILTAVWAVFVFSGSIRSWGWYPALAREIWLGLRDLPGFPRFAGAMLNHLVVLAAGAAFALAAVGGGRGVTGFLGFAGTGGTAERACVYALTGWLTLVGVFLGLALAGLFYPALLSSVAGLFLAFWLVRASRPMSWTGWSGRPAKGTVGLILLIALPVLAAFPVLFLPPLYIDFYQYHMAAPEHFLKLHRFVTENTTVGFQVFLSSELLNSLALILGRDSLAIFISMVPFVAGLALGMMWIGRGGNTRLGALAVGLSLATGWTLWVLHAGKNDLAAGGICVAAFLAQAKGRRLMAALLWGIACGTKINCLAFAGLAWVWHEAGRIREKRAEWRPDLMWPVLIGIPVVPWLVKSFIIKGDPLWPVLSSHLPWALWDAAFERARLMAMGRDRKLPDLLSQAFESVRANFPVAVSALPAVLLLGRKLPKGLRSMALMSVAAFAVFIIFVWPEPRYGIPLGMFWCFLAAVWLDLLMKGLSIRASKLVLAAVCGMAWVSVLGTTDVSLGGVNADSVRYLTGRLDLEGFLARRQTATWDARRALENAEGLRSVLLVNVDTAYRWPGRTVVEEWWGRKPTWVLTKQAEDSRRMSIRLKQKNVSHMALNFIMEFHVGREVSFNSAHKWSRRQVELLLDFMKKYTRVVIRPLQVDAVNGGYYIYEVSRDPGKPESFVYYLPGTQELVSRIHEPYFKEDNPAESSRLADRLVKDYPDVGVFRMLSARFSFLLGDWEQAYLGFSFVSERGMVGDISGVLYAESALYLGKYEETLKIAEKMGPLFPVDALLMDDIRSMALLKLAWEFAGKFSRYNEALAMAREAIKRSPGNPAAHVGFAMVLEKLGRKGEAKAVLLRAKAAWPDDHEVVEYCAKYLGEGK